MDPVFQEYCPGCDAAYAAVWVDGFCKACRSDLAAALTDHVVQKRAMEHRMFFDLVRQCSAWGAVNDYPDYKLYPQYDMLRSFGHFFNNNGGFDRMHRVLSMLVEEFKESDDGSWPRFVECAWDNIGDWQA